MEALRKDASVGSRKANSALDSLKAILRESERVEILKLVEEIGCLISSLCKGKRRFSKLKRGISTGQEASCSCLCGTNLPA